jgi:phospholipid/cholesterol/gamma-HCH transport system permease protein
MRVTEELDALETMALDPVAFLVVPKFLAMAMMLPCLTIGHEPTPPCPIMMDSQ